MVMTKKPGTKVESDLLQRCTPSRHRPDTAHTLRLFACGVQMVIEEG